MELSDLHTETEQIAAYRSRLYQLLAIAFAFPDEEFYTAAGDGSFAAVVRDLCARLPYDVPLPASAELSAVGDSYAAFESEYIRLFDVGAAGPPCPLYGGEHVGDRMKVMEEATRFYNFFQLRLSPQMRELPDHITTELEFMHYLTYREAEAPQHGHDPAPLRRAERDFLTRHLCKWLPHLQARLAKQTTLAFFSALVRVARVFFDADCAYAAKGCDG